MKIMKIENKTDSTQRFLKESQLRGLQSWLDLKSGEMSFGDIRHI